jgi:uncharacterized protein YrrD
VFKSKDFIFMDVIDVNGKKIGFIKDLLIDFNHGEVKGFVVSSNRIFNKNIHIIREDIIAFNETMIIKSSRATGLIEFLRLKNLDIIDHCGEIIGIIEDILFDARTFKISGIIVSQGFFHNFVWGKRIILIQSTILGDKNLLYYSKDDKINQTSVLHNPCIEVNGNEK